MAYDLPQYLTAIKERRGELAYDLQSAQTKVADIKREIAEADTAILAIQNDIKNAKGTIE